MAGEPSSPDAVFLLDLSESGTATWNSGLLLKALRERRIRTFTIEDVELLPPGGDEISEALVTAIEASKIAIVVVPGGTSHDVSLRRWNVLIYILDYFRRNPQRIIPVYYMDRSYAHSEPSGVHEEPSFEGRKKKFRVETGNDEYKVSKAIAQLDSLPGWDFDWHEKNKDKFNGEIASQVSKMLYRPPLDVAVYPVGLQSQLEEVWWLLKLTSSNREFLKIVFYGIQEGKSTLAFAVYNSIAHLFEVSCFLPNIRENSNTPHGLMGVQKMLLSQISGETGIQLENVSEGASMIANMLREKNVLLILDDVDSLDQLNALGRGPDWWWFSSGSRVIITTREKDWLGDHMNDFLPYNVQEGIPLNDIQTIQGALTTSQRVSEVSQVSQRVSEVSHTSLIDPEGSQTTRLAGQRCFQTVMWGLVFFVSSGVGLLCNALSPPFKRSIRGWTVFRFFPYVVFSLAVLATILRSNRYQIIRRLKRYICYVIFLGIAVYSYFYDRAVDGKPGILTLVSNAAFALASLSLSKLFGAEFETGMFSYFLECFTIQLITINWFLISVAIVIGGPLFGWHFSSEPFLLTRIIGRFGAIPPRKLND